MVTRKLVGLIVPDVHEKIGKVKTLLEKYAHADWVVFLGDFMDSFSGLTWETHETVRWLSENVFNPKYTFLWGNHDMHYAYPYNALICSGFDPQKLSIVKNGLGDKHWKQFKLFHWIGNNDPNSTTNTEFLLSHAGIHPYFLHPVHGWSHNFLKELEEEALYKLKFEQNVTALLACGRGRGGNARVGGVIWLDWNTEFTPIEGLNQIVGHSSDKTVRSKIVRDKSNDKTKRGSVISQNYCIDTNLRHVVLVYEDGNVSIENI